MNYDIPESVSQGSNGAYDEEKLRIQEVSDELQRLCRLHEELSRESKGYGSRFEIEPSNLFNQFRIFWKDKGSTMAILSIK